MYISVFHGVGDRREIIFRNVKAKTVTTVRNAVNRGVVHSSKKKFFETLCLIS